MSISSNRENNPCHHYRDHQEDHIMVHRYRLRCYRKLHPTKYQQDRLLQVVFHLHTKKGWTLHDQDLRIKTKITRIWEKWVQCNTYNCIDRICVPMHAPLSIIFISLWILHECCRTWHSEWYVFPSLAQTNELSESFLWWSTLQSISQRHVGNSSPLISYSFDEEHVAP